MNKLLEKYFYYKDGNLYWKVNKGTAKQNDNAGCYNKSGYLNTTFQRTVYRTHRLIFLMHHGYMPVEIDHIDGNKLNNKIENLRPANRLQNCKNTKIPITNKSGYKNVSWDKSMKKWRVDITSDKKKMYFGCYNDIDYAVFVADAMRHKYHKDFARRK